MLLYCNVIFIQFLWYKMYADVLKKWKMGLITKVVISDWPLCLLLDPSVPVLYRIDTHISLTTLSKTSECLKSESQKSTKTSMNFHFIFQQHNLLKNLWNGHCFGARVYTSHLGFWFPEPARAYSKKQHGILSMQKLNSWTWTMLTTSSSSSSSHFFLVCDCAIMFCKLHWHNM